MLSGDSGSIFSRSDQECTVVSTTSLVSKIFKFEIMPRLVCQATTLLGRHIIQHDELTVAVSSHTVWSLTKIAVGTQVEDDASHQMSSAELSSPASSTVRPSDLPDVGILHDRFIPERSYGRDRSQSSLHRTEIP